MFDSIIIRPNDSRQFPVNIGQVVEKLFFYKETTLHIGRSTLIEMLGKHNSEDIIKLFLRPELKVLYDNSPIGIWIQGEKDKAFMPAPTYITDFDIEKQLYLIHKHVTNDESGSKSFAERLSHNVGVHEFEPEFRKMLKAEILDISLVKKVIIHRLDFYYPGHGVVEKDIEFHVESFNEDYVRVISNLSVEQFPKIDTSDILLNVCNIAGDIRVMIDNDAEISVPELNSALLRLKIDDLLIKSERSQTEIEHFNYHIYDNVVAFQEIINSKAKSLEEIFPVLDKAAKFKSWISELPNDRNLLREYLSKVGEKTWIESAPSKAIRFYLTTTINTLLNLSVPQPAGVLLATGLSAFNSFVLDKLSTKWKPNQFIDGELKKMIS